jgi:hypothetical protein
MAIVGRKVAGAADGIVWWVEVDKILVTVGVFQNRFKRGNSNFCFGENDAGNAGRKVWITVIASQGLPVSATDVAGLIRLPHPIDHAHLPPRQF